MNIGKGNDEVAKWYIMTERKKLRHYSEKPQAGEMIKPSRILNSIFKPYDLTAYRKILNKWLYNAMSTDFLEESVTKYEVITVYEQLVKLFEAMWG